MSSYTLKIDKAWLVKTALIILIIIQAYSYMTAAWEVTRFEYSVNVYLGKTATINLFTTVFRYVALLFVVIASLKGSKLKLGDGVLILGLSLFCIIHSIITISQSGLITAFYSSYFPLIYLLVFAFYLGSDENVWTMIRSFSKIIMIVYALLFITEFLSSYSAYGWGIYTNASVVTYFSQLFWATTLYIYIMLENGQKSILIYVMLFIVCVGCVLLDSRSWIIQSALLVMFTVWALMTNSNQNIGRRLGAIFVIIIFIVIAVIVAVNYFPSYIEALIRKGAVDNRTIQYIEIASQTSIGQWIFGRGQSATYVSALYGDYTAIDNQTVFIAFHFGIFTALFYFWNYYRAFISCLKNKRSIINFGFSAGIIFIWLASLNGLSVFNGVSLDVKCVIMPLLIGRIYYKSQTDKYYISE